jgi:hypothetical protein
MKTQEEIDAQRRIAILKMKESLPPGDRYLTILISGTKGIKDEIAANIRLNLLIDVLNAAIKSLNAASDWKESQELIEEAGKIAVKEAK